MDKSHVGMGYHVCPVCGVEHDEVVLLDKSLQKTLTRHMFVGWKMCEEHQELLDTGYVALIEVKNQPSSLEDADRTGKTAHIRSSVWSQVFNSEAPNSPIVFCAEGTIKLLQEKHDVHHD